MSGIYWLASYPKSGNTWFRLVLRNFQRNADTPLPINELVTGSIASARSWLDEVLCFDTADMLPSELEVLRPHVYDWSGRDEEVGYHKIHDAYLSLVNGMPIVGRGATLGAIYIIRNPLDIVPSMAAYWGCSIDQAIENMGSTEATLARSRSRINLQVAQRLSTWSEHVLSWIEAPGLRHRVIRYEDMLAAPSATFAPALQFLELPLEAGRLERAIRFSDFSELSRQERESGFRENPPDSERFFRQGRSGGWRARLTKEQVQRVVEEHRAVMQRFGYLDEHGEPRQA